MIDVNLCAFSGKKFDKGACLLKRAMWFFVGSFFLKSSYNPFSCVKVLVLRLFGAKVGRRVVIKPSVQIKFPWKLEIGDDVWIGEHVWIDNLDRVSIGNNVCVSQGALLLTGNHDYSVSSFDYMNAPISLEDGVWIGARSIVCPGVVCRSCSVLSAGSVATKEMMMSSVYQGEPAKFVRKRSIYK